VHEIFNYQSDDQVRVGLIHNTIICYQHLLVQMYETTINGYRNTQQFADFKTCLSTDCQKPNFFPCQIHDLTLIVTKYGTLSRHFDLRLIYSGKSLFCRFTCSLRYFLSFYFSSMSLLKSQMNEFFLPINVIPLHSRQNMAHGSTQAVLAARVPTNCSAHVWNYEYRFE